jgi:hypothetical protein
VPEQPTPELNFTTASDGEGNTLAVSTEGQTVIVDVYSQNGIGRASVERVSEQVPEKIVLRLHLAGLEEFRLSYDSTILVASVSSTGSSDILQSILTPGGNERSLTQDSPLWMDLRVVTGQAATYFEITLPAELQRDLQRFSIDWIDFYR